MELLWQLFWAPCKIHITGDSNRHGEFSCVVSSLLGPPKMSNAIDYTGRTIGVIGGHWGVKTVSSLIIVFIIQHNLPKCAKSHFQGPKCQKFSAGACPRTALYCIPALIFKTLRPYLETEFLLDFQLSGRRGGGGARE